MEAVSGVPKRDYVVFPCIQHLRIVYSMIQLDLNTKYASISIHARTETENVVKIEIT